MYLCSKISPCATPRLWGFVTFAVHEKEEKTRSDEALEHSKYESGERTGSVRPCKASNKRVRSSWEPSLRSLKKKKRHTCNARQHHPKSPSQAQRYCTLQPVTTRQHINSWYHTASHQFIPMLSAQNCGSNAIYSLRCSCKAYGQTTHANGSNIHKQQN